MPEDQATKALRDAGFEVRARDVDTTDEQEDGTVLDQSPAAGEERKRGSTVTIRVGRLTVSATPTPSPTPSPSPTVTAAP
jgi:beta-lactam-binding protein with PASTA domain